jgi:hypothetical protein
MGRLSLERQSWLGPLLVASHPVGSAPRLHLTDMR